MESQNIEYKQNWRDEYIKWICGFANAEGGKLYIGIDDNGAVNGIEDSKKLLEDIPNKVREILGIVVDVNLLSKNKKYYLEIITESYPNPVNYKGQYYYRAGSTKQELKGEALNKFILKKYGKCWDAVPQLNLTLKNLSNSAFEYFRTKSVASLRLTEEDLKLKNEVLLDKLGLKADATNYKRATTLLFHPDPEKFVTGAYIKIGFFKDDDDLVFQDVISGYLFHQVEKALDILLSKYLKALISYDRLNRIETYPIPMPAIREALLNAVIHKDYSSSVPIQISVYVDKILIWNPGQLPSNWTVDSLKIKHPSQPFNPDIANCFFRSGLIESWGRGTLKIIEECKKAKIQLPQFKYDLNGFWVEFNYKNSFYDNSKNTLNSTDEKILILINENKKVTIPDLVLKLKLSESTIERSLLKLKKEKYIIRSGSKKSGEWIVNNIT